MLCGGAKYLEFDISVLILMSLFDAAVSTANVYGSFEEKRCLTKGALVLKVSLVLYIPLHALYQPGECGILHYCVVKKHRDMSNDPGECGLLERVKRGHIHHSRRIQIVADVLLPIDMRRRRHFTHIETTGAVEHQEPRVWLVGPALNIILCVRCSDIRCFCIVEINVCKVRHCDVCRWRWKLFWYNVLAHSVQLEEWRT